MTFLAPWFLAGILAISIPLFLHLRRSRRAEKIIFSTTQFFDETFLRSARRAKFQDLLLMILRMALLVFFALALAQPIIRTPAMSKWIGLGGKAREAAIILDDSASMAAGSERGILLERAKAGAISILDELSSSRGDKATVILAGQRQTGPKVLFEQPTNNFEAIRKAIREVTLTDLATDLEWAIRSAAQTIGAVDGSAASGGVKEIYIFSDFQESSLSAGADPTAGIQAAFFLAAVRPPMEQPPNLSVDAIQYGTARPMLAVPFTFRTLLTNYGPEPRSAAASLVIDGQTVSQKKVELPAGRSQLVRFQHRFMKTGWHGGKVVLAEEEAVSPELLPVDNQRFFALHVEDNLRLLAINGSPSDIPAEDELFFFRLALTVQPDNQSGDESAAETTAPVLIDSILPGEVTGQKLEGYRLVLLANVSDLAPAALEELEKYVDRGGNLLITLGDRVNPESYNCWVGSHRLHEGLLPGKLLRLAESADEENPVLEGDSNQAGSIAALNEKHPALAGFSEGKLGTLAGVRIRKRYEVHPGAAEPLMQDAGGIILLMEKTFGQGRVMLFTSAIDRDWSNFPLQPVYLPWLYRIVSYLTQPGSQRANFLGTGQIVKLPASVTELQTLQIFKPDGSAGYQQADPLEMGVKTPDTFSDTDQAGLYMVRLATESDAAQPQMMFAVNLPHRESQLRPLLPEEVKSLAGPDNPVIFMEDPESAREAVLQARQGYGAWDLLLWAALLVALAEPLLASQLSKRRILRAADALNRRDLLPAADHPAA